MQSDATERVARQGCLAESNISATHSVDQEPTSNSKRSDRSSRNLMTDIEDSDLHESSALGPLIGNITEALAAIRIRKLRRQGRSGAQ